MTDKASINGKDYLGLQFKYEYKNMKMKMYSVIGLSFHITVFRTFLAKDLVVLFVKSTNSINLYLMYVNSFPL